MLEKDVRYSNLELLKFHLIFGNIELKWCGERDSFSIICFVNKVAIYGCPTELFQLFEVPYENMRWRLFYKILPIVPKSKSGLDNFRIKVIRITNKISNKIRYSIGFEGFIHYLLSDRKWFSFFHLLFE